MAGQRMHRQCRECGAGLATDNKADLCSPCGRSLEERSGTAPKVPDHFWNSPELQTALATREFGCVLVAYRKAHDNKITQTDIGQWLGLTQSEVSRIERRKVPANDLTKLDRWARALRIPQRCLWFTFSPQSPDAYANDHRAFSLRSTPDAEGDDVRRRQFLKSAGVGLTTVGASLLSAESATVPPPTTPDRRLNPDVAEVREMTQAFRRLDNRYGGGHSRSSMATYLKSSVEPMLRDGHQDSPARDDLLSATAELYQLAGWMAYDTGQADTGRRYLRRALKLCQDSGNDALSAEMLAGMSHHAAFHGAPEDAVDLALAAKQLARRSGVPALKAEVAVLEAHGWAIRRDKQACLAALSEAEHEFSGADQTDAPSWLTYFDSAYLAAKFAHTFRDLGQPREAELFARRSLEMSDGYERGRLFNTALLASTLADQRQVDEACSLAQRAVQMGQSVRSVRSAAYLADVARRLAPFRIDTTVQSLYGQMVDTGIPVPRS